MPEPRDIGIWGYGDTETMERINPALARKNPPQRRRATEKNFLSCHSEAERSAAEESAFQFGNSAPGSPASPGLACWGGGRQFGNRRGTKYCAAYARIEQAIKAADLLLAGGGFGLVAIDLAGLPPEAARRIPLTTWFRLRRAVESLPAVLLLVSPQPLTQSCAALALRLERSPSRAALDGCHPERGRRGGRVEGSRLNTKDSMDCHPEEVAAATDEGSAFPSHSSLLTGLRLRAEVVRSPLAGRKRPQSAYAEILTEAKWA